MIQARSAALVLVVALLTTGCASHRAARAREASLRRELDALRYEPPIERVWEEVRRLLAESGYPLAPEDRGDGAAERAIAWLGQALSVARRTQPDGRGGLVLETAFDRGFRYRAEAWPADGGIRVVLWRIEEERTEHKRDAGRSRGAELELELARRLAPAEAARIEAALPARR